MAVFRPHPAVALHRGSRMAYHQSLFTVCHQQRSFQHFFMGKFDFWNNATHRSTLHDFIRDMVVGFRICGRATFLYK